jgi:hypothetical protein
VTPPYQQPGANIAFGALFVLFLLGEQAIRVRSRANRGGRRAERWSLFVVVACIAAAIGAGFRPADWGPGSIVAARWPVFVAGIVLMAAGFGLRQWAF